MNATADYGKSFMSGKSNSIKDANNNGERFANYLILNGLSLANTWFQHKRIHRDTWYSNTGKTSKTFDYASTSKWMTQYVMDCMVRTSHTFKASDHRLLVVRIKTPRRKKDINVFIKKKKEAKFDVKSLKVEYVRSSFIKKVDSLCTEIENDSVGIDEFANMSRF